MTCPKQVCQFCDRLSQTVNPDFCRVECRGGQNVEVWKRRLAAPAAEPLNNHPFCTGCPHHKACRDWCLLLTRQTNLTQWFAAGKPCPIGRTAAGAADDRLVSVILLARTEPLLQQTVDNLQQTARGPVEFVVVLDGPDTPDPRPQPNLTVIRHDSPHGRRPSTNEAAAAAAGEFLFHVDAHVRTDTIGWDLIFKSACTDNRTMIIPSLDKLILPDYRCKGRRFGHKYITAKMKDAWSGIKCHEPFEETICGNGMGWFLPADYYRAFGGCDDRFGAVWGNFGLEWALKVWLTDPDGRGPGRVLLSRDIVFAHMWKDAVGYATPGAAEGRRQLFDFVDGTAPNQVRPFAFLEERLPHLIPFDADGDRAPLLANQPAVTAIMNTNGLYPELIEEAVESFLRQDYPNKHLLIVNTHSQPLTIKDKPGSITVENVPPFERFPHQIAYAVKRVTTPYWCVMDSDDIFFAGHLTQLIEGMLGEKKKGLQSPAYVVVPRAWEQQAGRPAKERHRGWWCCLYDRVAPERVDAAFDGFLRKNQKDTGSDLHFIKQPWWNVRTLETAEITVLHRLGVGFHIRREHDRPGWYKQGIARSRTEPLPELVPHWRTDYEGEHNYRRTVNIRMKNHLGDVVCAEPAIRNLKAHHPNWRICVYSKFPDLFADHPAIDAAGPLSACRRFDYDLKVRRGSHLVDWLTPGAEWIVDRTPHLWCRASIERFGFNLNETPTVVISTRTNAVHKRWNREKWRRLVQWLRDTGYQTVQVGVGEKNIGCDYNLSDQTSLAELAEICRQAQFTVCIDAGVQHVSIAAGTPAVVLFGPADPATVVHGKMTIPVHAAGACRDCWTRDRIGRKCPKGDASCMFDITVDDVIATKNEMEIEEKVKAERQASDQSVQTVVNGVDYFDYTRRERNYEPYAYGTWQRQYAAMMDRVLDLRGKKVLDVGCAGGATVKGFCEVAGADAFGCDVNTGVIEKTPFTKKRRRLAVVPTDRLRDHFGAESFDVVHCQQVFEHFPGRDYSVRVIGQLWQVLNPGGIAYVALVTGPHKTADDLANDPGEDATHINIWPMDWWRQAFERLGFADVTDRFQPSFEAEPLYRQYLWSQLVVQKPE